MKKILLQILTTIILVSCSNQEQINIKKGILWEVESQSGIKSYIFGTIHLYPKNEVQISEKVFVKLKRCKTLALESDLTNQREQKKISSFEMPKYLLEIYEIIASEYGNELVGMEEQLIEVAQLTNKNISGLETADELLDILKRINNIEISDDIFILEEMLIDYKESIILYNEESIEDIKENLKLQMGDKITNMLIDERNKNWIEDVLLLIDNESTFIAVGIGHLAGNDGILNLLIKKGYKLERVAL